MDYRSTKRIVTALSAIVGLSLLAGCGRHSTSEKYYLVAMNTDLPYWKNAAAGFEKAAAEYGVKAEVRGPTGLDADEEAKDFHDIAATKPAGILVSVASSKAMAPEIDAAIAAGIPVITMDSDAPESKRLYFIGTNNLEAGHLGGARLAAKLNGKGNVVFISNPGQPNLDERLKGYKEALVTSPGIKVVEVFDMQGDSRTAMDKTRDYLSRTGKDRVDAIVCLESASAKDVGEIFKRTNTKDRILMGMDLEVGTLLLVQDGTVDSTIAQKPYSMGYLGLKALDEVHHNAPKKLVGDYDLDPYSPYPNFVDTGTSLVDKSNVGAELDKARAVQLQ